MDNSKRKNPFAGIRATRWIRFGLATALYIAFTVWLGNYYLLFGLILLVDIYLTKFIPWGCWKKTKNKTLKKTLEWVDAILYALVAVYLINNFLFQNYKIPTSSLEKSLLVGDYLFVSKVSYGPRVPMTPLSFPLAQHTMPVLNCKSYIEKPQIAYRRLKGLGSIRRNDIVVFNFPTGDSVPTRISNPDYYTLCFMEGADRVRNNKAVYGDIVYRPVDRRENYVKRCVGLPGDTFEIRDNQIYINSVAAESPTNLQFNYYVMLSSPEARLSGTQFEELGVAEDDRTLIPNDYRYYDILDYLGFERNATGRFNTVYRMPLTQKSVNKLLSMPVVAKVIQEPGGAFGGEVFPLGSGFGWSRDNFGPLYIPRKGDTIALTPENWKIYERAIKNYEGNDVRVADGRFFINGREAKSYTFGMNYFFMMGDNRDNSADSRYWGLVPEDHIVGKPIFVWLSLDPDKGWFNGHIRFDRVFRSVESLVK